MAPEAPNAFAELDPLIHERSRLAILTSLLARPDGVAFTDLRKLCALTDGNLSRHLAVLEEAGLVCTEKSFAGRRPLTTCRATPEGRRRFAAHIAALERVVRDGARAVGAVPVPARS